MPWFWNLSLSCLWSGCPDREIEFGSLWLRNGATMHLWCFAIQQSFVVLASWGTVHTQCLFLLQSPLIFWENSCCVIMIMDPRFFIRLCDPSLWIAASNFKDILLLFQNLWEQWQGKVCAAVFLLEGWSHLHLVHVNIICDSVMLQRSGSNFLKLKNHVFWTAAALQHEDKLWLFKFDLL